MISPFFPPIVDDPGGYPNAEWSEQSDKYRTWYDYFTGTVLDETEDNDDEVVAKYPIKINLARVVSLLNAYAILGEWDDHVFSWRSLERSEETGIDFLDEVGRLSRLNARYIQQTLTYVVLGGCVWGIRKNPLLPTKVRWVAIPPESFFPVYSSLDDDLIEAFVVTSISAREAKLVWGVSAGNDEVQYVEHWTKSRYEIWVDDTKVKEGTPPGHVIPYEYMPRPNLTGERYGYSVIEDIRGLQDELNARLADIGDAVHRETHKNMVLSNLPGGIKGIRSSSGITDLGMGLGNAQPTVHDVSRAVVPTGSFEMVNALIDFSRYAGSTPPVAYGEDEGSQRSGMTLVMRMWPLVQSAKSSRAILSAHMASFAHKTIAVANASGLQVPSGVYTPDFPPILPRDREQIVNEVVQLAGVNRQSEEMALEKLGVPESEQAEELSRIQALRQEEQRMLAQSKAVSAGNVDASKPSNG